MDMLMVCCGPPGSGGAAAVRPGEYAVLFGPGGPSLRDAAGLLGTAQSDLTCDLTRRVQRRWINAPPQAAMALPSIN